VVCQQPQRARRSARRRRQNRQALDTGVGCATGAEALAHDVGTPRGDFFAVCGIFHGSGTMRQSWILPSVTLRLQRRHRQALGPLWFERLISQPSRPLRAPPTQPRARR